MPRASPPRCRLWRRGKDCRKGFPPEIPQPLTDGLVGERGDPQTDKGFGTAEIVVHVTENQLSSRPASVAAMMDSHLSNSSRSTSSCLTTRDRPCTPYPPAPDGGTSLNSCGNMGRCSRRKPEKPLLSGMARPTRCPNAHVTAYPSPLDTRLSVGVRPLRTLCPVPRWAFLQ